MRDRIVIRLFHFERTFSTRNESMRAIARVLGCRSDLIAYQTSAQTCERDVMQRAIGSKQTSSVN